jgi:hypothetical protein
MGIYCVLLNTRAEIGIKIDLERAPRRCPLGSLVEDAEYGYVMSAIYYILSNAPHGFGPLDLAKYLGKEMDKYPELGKFIRSIEIDGYFVRYRKRQNRNYDPTRVVMARETYDELMLLAMHSENVHNRKLFQKIRRHLRHWNERLAEEFKAEWLLERLWKLANPSMVQRMRDRTKHRKKVILERMAALKSTDSTLGDAHEKS